jgi:hypothetical protein
MSIFLNNKIGQSGNVLIVTMLFFTAITLSIGMGLVLPVLRSYRAAEHSIKSKESYAASESGVEDVLYRLKNNLPVSSTETLVLGEEVATTSISDISSDKKEITALGDSSNRFRTVAAVVEAGSGLSFNYGLQVGRGGLMLDGSSGIKGNVYANGNITACGSCYITGSAVAANSESETIDQQNGSGIPAYDISFGNNTATEDIAQSFTLSTAIPLSKVQVYLKKTGSPSNATVYITTDSSGKPSTTYLAQGSLSASGVTTSYNWTDILFTTNPTLQAGTTYWLVINASANASKYYTIGANSNGYSGTAKTGKYSGSWSATTPAQADLFFKLYLGGFTSSITGTGNQYFRFQVGTSGSGYAKAHTITNTAAPGALYCQSGSGNNKTCDTSQSDATPRPWPVTDANIVDWKAQAAAGGTLTGNQYPGNGYQTVSLGPKKIAGDLHVGGSATLVVNGTLWVTGDLLVDGAAIVKLNSNYGSADGVIVVDGKVKIAGSSPVQGSGTSGSYLMVVSLSDCPTSSSCGSANAIDVSGAAGAVVLVAQNGTIAFSGSAHAKQATGYAISLEGSTDVSYESGLADMTFDSGPSGAWNVTSWKEK